MSLRVYSNRAWRNIVGLSAYDSGAWRRIQGGWIYNNQEWRKFYNLPISVFTYSDGTTSTSRDTTITQASYTRTGKTLINANMDDGVWAIGSSAFSNCQSLSGVTIPNSVISIGDRAFERCSNTARTTGLRNIVIGNGVTSIGNYAFERCGVLRHLTIPDNVNTIGDSMGSSCSSLTGVTIGSGVSGSFVIGGATSNTISYNSFLSSPISAFAVSPNNLHFSNDEYGVLFNKNKTQLLIHPPGTTRTTYTVPAGVTSIEESAFYFCRPLTNITIANSVTAIRTFAFIGCWLIPSFTIPSGVTVFGQGPFRDCNSCNKLYFKGSPPTLGQNGMYFTGTVYYCPTKPGWQATFDNQPTVADNTLC